MEVVLLENIDKLAVKRFESCGFKVRHFKEAWDNEQLIKMASRADVLCVRSRTLLHENTLKFLPNLKAIGVFGIGVNHVDLEACSRLGITVFNAPYSNTRSVVELTLGSMIMLFRHAFEKSSQMHQGVWNKSSAGCFEVRGKKLGIVGYGSIGSQLSVLAENLGMEVYYYDLVEKLSLGNAQRCDSMQELLSLADVVTMHVDGRKENYHLIDKAEFSQMKHGVMFLNLSRGMVVDTLALADAVQSGKVAGVACDVYEVEPKNNDEPFVSVLQGLPNVILTPHIGAATSEAQGRIADFVSNKLVQYMADGDTSLSCNFPDNQMTRRNGHCRFIHMHRNIPGVLADVNNVLAEHRLNIEGQSLRTNGAVGYVITDVGGDVNEKILKRLWAVSGTIRVRRAEL